MTSPTSRLKRAQNPMTGEIRDSLEREGLMSAYEQRPPYQRNDYLGWISRARRPETREKRLQQMLSELRGGDRYMKMVWSAGGGARE